MKIAVTYENGMVFQHFGHTQQFKLYEVNGGQISEGKIVDAGGSGHGALAGFLKSLGVEALICGGIGGGARSALAEAGIAIYPGVSGVADVQAAALAEGKLVYDPNTMCAHHHEGESHSCRSESHGCGESCGK